MDEVGLVGVDTVSLVALILKSNLLGAVKAPIAQHDSILTGQLYLKELLETRSTARFHNVTRMDRDTFDELLLLLESRGGFKNPKYISAEDKLLIFILVLVSHTNRSVNERWQHSGSIISLVVHEVATVIKMCKQYLIVPPAVLDPCGRTGYTEPTGRTGPRHDPPDPSAYSTLTSLHTASWLQPTRRSLT